jgi:hypothetical protein
MELFTGFLKHPYPHVLNQFLQLIKQTFELLTAKLLHTKTARTIARAVLMNG